MSNKLRIQVYRAKTYAAMALFAVGFNESDGVHVFTSAGWYRIETVFYLEPKSVELREMLESKWDGE